MERLLFFAFTLVTVVPIALCCAWASDWPTWAMVASGVVGLVVVVVMNLTQDPDSSGPEIDEA